MNYRAIYLLSIMGIGLLFAVRTVPQVLTGPSIPTVVLAISGIGMVVTAGYELTISEDPHGPTQLNIQFVLVVGGFLLAAGGALLSL